MNQRQWIQMEDTSGTTAQKVARVSWALVAAATVLFFVIGFCVGLGVELAAVGFIASFLFARSIKSSADSRVRAHLSVVPASENDHARIFNVVDGLCVVSGDHRPVIEIVASDFPVAIAFGTPADSTIVVSNGFCDVMDRVETEAVMAHLLWRIRSGDAELTTYLINLNAKLSQIGLGVVARKIVPRLANAQALLWADIAACQATRYPPALASALEKVEASKGSASTGVSAPLWFGTPSTGSATNAPLLFPNLGVSYPSLAERIGVLKEI